MFKSKLSADLLEQLSPEESAFLLSWERLYNDSDFQAKLDLLKSDKMAKSKSLYNVLCESDEHHFHIKSMIDITNNTVSQISELLLNPLELEKNEDTYKLELKKSVSKDYIYNVGGSSNRLIQGVA